VPGVKRRPLLKLFAAAPFAPAALGTAVLPGRALVFPRDHGAHPEARIEWWYATGWLRSGAAFAPTHGFQITFFRSRTGIEPNPASRFTATQILFAHAALTDLSTRRSVHDQRIAREGLEIAEASQADTSLTLRDWSLVREGPLEESVYRTSASSESAGFGFELRLEATQPLLLQGETGYSRKGPKPGQASHYYSRPQLAVSGKVVQRARSQAVQGRAWLDHEWSDEILDAQAVGWDWIGINLTDGGALTAFRLRREDGSALWSGGSHRSAAGVLRNFADGEVVFRPGRLWESGSSRARYPVEWELQTPAGSHRIRALADAQELDSRGSTGSIYWEGLSELLDSAGSRVGLGYLEMTGYTGRLKL
jgi:predicted secreted hydrolase